jgi:heptosyltransferase III
MNVLIYRTGQLGDAIISLPAIYAIKKKHPKSKIYLLTDSRLYRLGSHAGTKDILDLFSLVDEFITYEVNLNSKINSLYNFFFALYKLRNIHFSFLYNLSFRMSKNSVLRDRLAFLFFVRPVEYIGVGALSYSKSNNGAPLPTLMPEWQRLLNVVDMDVLQHENIFPLPKISNAFAQKFLSLEFFKDSNYIFAVAPGSKMQSKCWPSKNYVTLCRLILKFYQGSKVVLVGSSLEASICEEIATQLGANNAISIAGQITIAELTSVLGVVDAFIGNDSGAMHLAAMAGAPIISIFSSRDYPGLWYPYGKNHLIYRKYIECEGCMLEKCSRNNECLSLTTPDEVFKGVLGMRISS